ncbi:MAG: tRNA uridine-5-carboxymethylaminomethyl(34) synthesis GTPase MnmE [Firmicutes bacterium]|nr:tRNA uridine-5-carboxymethylaminomethyl(34) synthesis GTPase MnmE [Bacillota bacterium]
MQDTTIAAISTAYGEAGIGVIRISGPEALSVGKAVFKPASEKCRFVPRKMYFGRAKDALGNSLDQVLFVYFKAPFSYTGEDVVEIQCHGSLMSQKAILAAILQAGAEAAEKGEFTKRAFINGKLDLSQAEAVIDLIKARSSRGFELAEKQLEGKLSRKVKDARQELLDCLVDIAVNMDYPDEDIELIQYEKLINSLLAINDELLKMLESAEEGRIAREGLSVAIVGSPNVGKSSLMNYLLNEDRSIVTDIPGTTRDTVEEQASIRGIQLRLVDTAGIHDTSDLVESLGIERSRESFSRADLVLLVIDASSELTAEDKELLELCRDRNALIVLNKQDLDVRTGEEEIRNYCPDGRIISCSVLSGTGLSALEDAIESIAGGNIRREDLILSNARHIQLVRNASGELEEAVMMAKAKEALDFIEVNVHAAFDYLGEITGDTAGDELINEIFSRFCLGK